MALLLGVSRLPVVRSIRTPPIMSCTTAVHQSTLVSPHFENVLRGDKTLALRVNDHKRRAINAGDEWHFEPSLTTSSVAANCSTANCSTANCSTANCSTANCSTRPAIVKTTILSITTYGGFCEAVHDIAAQHGLDSLLPGMHVDQAIALYNGLNEGKYEQDAITYGVACFALDVMD